MNTEKEKIFKLVKEYYEKYHKKNKSFTEGDRINYAGRVFDEKEIINLVDSALDFWLTSGAYTKEFEKKFGEQLGVKYVSTVNSGSSANLIAFNALTSPLLKDRRINKGDEVITVACCFPTTVAPIIQYGAVPVFLDVEIPGYNIDTKYLEEAYTEKTKCVMIAHALGNPFNLKAVKEFCDKHNLWLIEDNCDALGSKFILNGKEQFTGTFGDIGTSSFYPPHHITMGEGGCVYTNNPLLHKIIRSLRDWGRDCICESGKDNRCGKRFNGKFGELPLGYDHKYVYSHFGYNLKVTDMQAAVGCAQLDKLVSFTKARIHNYNLLDYNLKKLNVEDKLILPVFETNSIPSPFGYMITCKDGVDRDAIVSSLESNNIQTRMLFSGNIVKQPCFDDIRDNTKLYRIVGDLNNTDTIMSKTFWVGVYPGMNDEMIEYMAKCINESINQKLMLKKQ